MVDASVAAFVNHLLEAAPWARERLSPFMGRTGRVKLRRCRTSHSSSARTACSTLPTRPSRTSSSPSRRRRSRRLARRDESVLGEMTFAGDAELAAALQYLARHLEWDVEEDLSRVVGDVAAHRIAGTARDFVAWQKEAGVRLGQNVAEYLTEEAGVLAPPAAVPASRARSTTCATRSSGSRSASRTSRRRKGGAPLGDGASEFARDARSAHATRDRRDRVDGLRHSAARPRHLDARDFPGVRSPRRCSG